MTRTRRDAHEPKLTLPSQIDEDSNIHNQPANMIQPADRHAKMLQTVLDKCILLFNSLEYNTMGEVTF